MRSKDFGSAHLKLGGGTCGFIAHLVCEIESGLVGVRVNRTGGRRRAAGMVAHKRREGRGEARVVQGEWATARLSQ